MKNIKVNGSRWIYKPVTIEVAVVDYDEMSSYEQAQLSEKNQADAEALYALLIEAIPLGTYNRLRKLMIANQ